MPNQWTNSLESLCRMSDRTIDAIEHRYLKELALSDQIDVWKVKDILDRCVCYALSSGFVIIMLEIIMKEECRLQGVPFPRESRLNVLDDEPEKRPPYDDEDNRLAKLRETNNEKQS